MPRLVLRTLFFSAAMTLCACVPNSARADQILSISSSDFGITDTFNEITQFNFEIAIAEPLVAGGVYNDPTITSVDYSVNGVLGITTPSGFPGFALVRSMTGTEFYGQSPESSLQFSIDAGADLSDGVQLSELVGVGTDTIFYLNAREFNQNPGRYHPPEFLLRGDGTGLLRNANNQSTFPNPPPPMGSGLLVNLTTGGEEYISDLTFTASAVQIIAAVPEPTTASLLAGGFVIAALCRRRA